jgi:hypothetical protein
MDGARPPFLILGRGIAHNGCPCTTLPEANRAEGNVGEARGAPSPADNQVKRM